MRLRAAVLGLALLVPALAAAQPTFDAATAGTPVTGNTQQTISHTTGAGSNRVLYCAWSSGGNSVAVSSATYAGNAGTEIYDASDGNGLQLAVYRWLAPTSGANNAVVTFASSTNINGGCISFAGVDQVTPNDSVDPVTDISDTTDFTNDVASAVNDLVVDFVTAVGDGASGTAGAGQTERIDVAFAGDAQLLLVSHEAGAASVTMSWTLNVPSGSLHGIGINLNVAGGGGGGALCTMTLLGAGKC